ncbi:MAG: cobalamin-binding protein [Chlorobiaceae bacterium]|nr:cobalamin-binding protein [Chlorobiaceae bacterium]
MPNIRSHLILKIFFIVLPAFWSGCSQKEAAQSHTPQNNQRIVSLAPSITEMIFAIGAGDHLVGRTSACDWPLSVKNVPVIGAFGRPSLELLASINPDLVIDVDLAEEDSGKKITSLGIQRATITCKKPDDIPSALIKLGKLTGHSRQADSLANAITNGLAQFSKKAGNKKQHNLVYLEIWDDPLWTGGKGSYTSALIGYAGGKNIGDVVDKEYFEISQEWVVEKNPDIIACMYMSKSSSAAGAVMNRPGWQHIAAVKNGRVYERFDNSIFLRPGPRVIEGIQQLYKTINQNDELSK